MSKFTERFPSKNTPQTNAPIVFLVGTSTAGKSTVCDEVIKQDQGLGIRIWGNDLEIDQDGPRCREHLSGNTKFEAIRNSFDKDGTIFVAMVFGNLSVEVGGKRHSLQLLNDDQSHLSDEKFEENLANFTEVTGGCYDQGAIRTLRELSEENPGDFRKVAGFNGRDLAIRTVDAAIRNSKQGIPTVLDVVPVDEKSIETYTNRLKEMGHECPVHTVLLHVPLDELTKRMEKRNKDAMSEGGNPNNRRDGLFPHHQYGQIFGASEDGVQVGHLSVKLAHEAVEKFGEEKGVKIRDMKRDSTPEASAEEKHKSAMGSVFATLREGKRLRDHLGFEDGSTTLDVKTKASANAVYEHGTGTTAEIAGKIYDWISQEMEKAKEPRSFTQKILDQGSTFLGR